MNIQYDVFVSNLTKQMGSPTLNLLHAAVGMSGESGEVLDMVKKHWVYGKELDKDKLVLELGDTMYYLQAAANEIGVSLDEIVRRNMEKLTKRFGSTYSDQAAIERADVNDTKQIA